MSTQHSSPTTLPLQSRHRSQPTEPLRKFAGVHINEDCRHLTGTFENHLFYGCTFGSLKNLVLKDCVLDKSTFTETDPAEMLGLTVTLNCHSFAGVELSPEAFDLICMLLVKTKGNFVKRQMLIQNVVGEKASRKYLTLLKDLETAQCADG